MASLFSHYFFCGLEWNYFFFKFTGVMKSINEPVTEDMLLDIVNQIVQNLAHRRPQKRPLPQNANELMPPPPPKFPRS